MTVLIATRNLRNYIVAPLQYSVSGAVQGRCAITRVYFFLSSSTPVPSTGMMLCFATHYLRRNSLYEQVVAFLLVAGEIVKPYMPPSVAQSSMPLYANHAIHCKKKFDFGPAFLLIVGGLIG